MSLFRGNGLKTMGAHVPADAGSKRLIRPLCYVPKSLVHEAALDLGFPEVKSCPYLHLLDETGDRAYLHRLLADLGGGGRRGPPSRPGEVQIETLLTSEDGVSAARAPALGRALAGVDVRYLETRCRED